MTICTYIVHEEYNYLSKVGLIQLLGNNTYTATIKLLTIVSDNDISV